MDTRDKIRHLCELKKISIPNLEIELGFSNGSLSKRGFLRSDRLKAIADYFGVTMDYLMGRPEKDRIAPPYESNAEFMSYIYRFWALSPEYREDIYKAIRHAERDMEDVQAEKAKKRKGYGLIKGGLK